MHMCYMLFMCFLYAAWHCVKYFSNFWFCYLCVFLQAICKTVVSVCACVFDFGTLVLCFLFVAFCVCCVCKPSAWVWRVCVFHVLHLCSMFIVWSVCAVSVFMFWFVLSFLVAFSVCSMCKPSVWVWRVCEVQTDGVGQETLPVISQGRDKRTAEDKLWANED